MSTEIYYFSGTGNSLHVARKLQEIIPGSKLVPIAALLNQEVIAANAQTVGIIFPLQGPTFPNAVKIFLEKLDLKSADYIFAIATRAGTTCRTYEEINKILKKKGRSLDSHFVLTVFNNDPKLKSDGGKYAFHVPSKDELLQKENELKPKLEKIKNIILDKKKNHEKDTEYAFKYGFLFEKIILFMVKSLGSRSVKNYFYADSKCTGCGICEKVCLSKRIKVVEDKPVWNDKTLCYMCYSCLNFCPAESVQINSKWYMKSYTTTQGRYSHPYTSIKDMENQRNR